MKRTRQQHTPDSEHCCCGHTGRVTTHFFQQTPSSDNGWTHPDFPLVITLFSEPLLRLLVLPEESGQRQDCIYQANRFTPWHVSHTCHRGLPAPPVRSYFIVNSAYFIAGFYL